MAAESPSEAEVMSWFETLSNWGRWGDDDLLGTLNLITPEKRAQAAALVTEGTQVSCAWTITYARDADAISPPGHFMLAAGDVEVPDDQLGRTNAIDAFTISPHGFTITHLDAPSHTFWRSREGEQRTMFNGVPANRVRVRDGATAGSVELAGDGIVSRGVLLDIPRLRGVDWLEPGTAIAPEELEAAEAAQAVRVEPGDVLFIRTGYPRLRDERGPQALGTGHPGPDARCVPWVRERDVALLGCDVANDVRPLEFPRIGGPFHGIGMGSIGLWLLDNCNHEELAKECARLGRWEFMVTIAALKLKNGTGSPVNPIALF